MTFKKKAVTTIIRILVDILCRIDDNQLDRVPQTGPLLLVSNHINFLEGPVIYTHLQPRQSTGYAAAKSWKNPFFAFLFDQWGIISIKRGEPDIDAIRKGLDYLKRGWLLAIAPEGTRSGNGRLQRGRPGVVILAQKTNIPILPVAHYGGERFWQNLKKLRRTNFSIVVGQPFLLKTNGHKVNSEIRQKIVDEIMFQIAALLPPPYRGVYSDLSEATEDYLYFPPPSRSNLLLARNSP
jgi:1-acyl-sn-glycerol-3-phosphate acyltransferase